MKGKNSVEIYQLKEAYVPIGFAKGIFLFHNPKVDVSNIFPANDSLFDPYEDIENGFDRRCYEKVHTWYSSKISHTDILSDTWRKFQDSNKPKSFKGRSISVTDIVVIGGQPYFCRQMGWQRIEWKQANACVVGEQA